MARRVTRSQSRELDDPIQDRAHWSAVPGKGVGKANRLSMVAENSPANSHQKVTSAGTSVVPESPEHYDGNISGTTFLPQEDSDPGNSELEPIVMLDELPALLEASERLLNLLKTNAPDSRQVVDAAKKLANPRNTENKRLKPATRKLVSQMRFFGSQRFIDIPDIQRLIPTVQLSGVAQPWSPSPALQRANCARLALDVLLATMGSQSPSETIQLLESEFPAPFLNNVVTGRDSVPIGGSTALHPTFEMALEIRTQFALVELDRRQKEKGFDARSVLESIFFDAENTSDSGVLRGFNLAGTFSDENGRLPDRFQDRVSDRFSELDYALHDDDGDLNIKGLKATFWSRFLVCTARFVQSRDKELRLHLELQPKLEDIKDQVERLLEDVEASGDHQELEEQESAVASQADRSSPAAEAPHNNPSLENDPEDNELFVPRSSPPARQMQASQESLGQRTPTSQTEQQRPKSANRRLSSKQGDLARNMDFLQRRREARQQQEMARSSQGPSNSQDVSFPSPGEVIRNPEGVTVPEEIAQTPEQELRYPPNDNDDTLINDGEELNLRHHRHSELMQSTSPPGSERTRQVSYNQGRFFDSPQRNQVQNGDEPAQRRTLLDQQEHRTRVNWSSEDESQLTARHQTPAKPTTQQSTKRGHNEVDNDSEDDSDDAFDSPAPKPVASPRGRQRLLQLNKRQRTSVDDDSSAADQIQSDFLASRHSQTSQPQQSQSPSTKQGPSRAQAQSYEPDDSQAVMARARSEAINPPPSQSRWSQVNEVASSQIPNMRRRWTANENDRLVTLIERYGTAWAEIKAQDDICPRSAGGPQLQGRTQVNLKDRARNLKKKYEREGTALPRNFEFIKS